MALAERRTTFLVEIDGRRQVDVEIQPTLMTCRDLDLHLRRLNPGATVTVNTADPTRSKYFFCKYVDPQPGVPAPLRS